MRSETFYAFAVNVVFFILPNMFFLFCFVLFFLYIVEHDLVSDMRLFLAISHHFVIVLKYW